MGSSFVEEHIISLIQRNERTGISLLYDTYSASLFGIILKIVDNQEIAEEVLQDTIVKAWSNIHNYDNSKGRLFTWLLNIARNTAIDATRKKDYNIVNHEINNVLPLIDRNYTTSFNPEIIDMRRLANNLPFDYKTLIDLIYFQGYTQNEVAETLCIPLGTVKTRIKAAILKLKAMI